MPKQFDFDRWSCRIIQCTLADDWNLGGRNFRNKDILIRSQNWSKSLRTMSLSLKFRDLVESMWKRKSKAQIWNRKYKHLLIKVIKKCSKQILKGLEYHQTHDPFVFFLLKQAELNLPCLPFFVCVFGTRADRCWVRRAHLYSDLLVEQTSFLLYDPYLWSCM